MFRELAISYMGRNDLAHVEIDDLEPDAMGRGKSDKALQAQPTPSGFAVSNGYVRGSLSVIEGGRLNPESLDQAEINTQSTKATGTDGALQMEAELNAEIVTLSPAAGKQLDLEYIVQEERTERIRNARLKGYEGDACTECGNFTMVRNGTCLNATPAAQQAGVADEIRAGLDMFPARISAPRPLSPGRRAISSLTLGCASAHPIFLLLRAAADIL